MNLVAGYISQSRLSGEEGLLQITPGVHWDKQGEGNQRYMSPRGAVTERGADLVVMVRGIRGLGTRPYLRYRPLESIQDPGSSHTVHCIQVSPACDGGGLKPDCISNMWDCGFPPS